MAEKRKRTNEFAGTYIRWGKHIKRERTHLGLTLEALGQKVGVSRQAVWQWERGITAPSDVVRLKLAALFGLEVEELFPMTIFPKARKHVAA